MSVEAPGQTGSGHLAPPHIPPLLRQSPRAMDNFTFQAEGAGEGLGKSPGAHGENGKSVVRGDSSLSQVRTEERELFEPFHPGGS